MHRTVSTNRAALTISSPRTFDPAKIVIIAVQGPSRAGKTTLARIIARVVRPRLPIICGDDFIEQDQNDIGSLGDAIAKHDGLVFEHISAGAILDRLGIVADIIVSLTPSTEVIESRLGRNILDLVAYQRQLSAVSSFVTPDTTTHLKGDSISEVLPSIIQELRRRSQFPVPVQCFVVKVASRCNLNCTYCYMYQAADRKSEEMPISMSAATANSIARRIREYIVEKDLRECSIIFHGGEPLSLPVQQFRSLVAVFQTELNGIEGVTYGVQTNGTRFSSDYLQLLDDTGFSIGVSLDGGTEHSNRHRVGFTGKPAFEDIWRGIKSLQEYNFKRGRFSGVLSVLDPEDDGTKTYRFFSESGITAFDFLLRDDHHGTPEAMRGNPERVGRFLIDAFDAWLDDPHKHSVRLFKALIAQIFGVNWTSDAVGLHPITTLGVSTDGSWELLDVMRATFPGAWETGLNAHQNSVSEVLAGGAYQRLMEWQFGLSEKCLGCRELFVCGGGYLPHRYSPETLFRNPSIHCESMLKFLSHVRLRTHELYSAAAQ